MRWEAVRIGEVCEVVSGATPKTVQPEYWDGDVLWVTPKDLSGKEGKTISETERRITTAGLQSCSARMLPAGSVLFSSRAPIRLLAINRVPVWWLRVHKTFMEKLGRGATFKEVSKSIVEKVEIPLPPLAEQKRIAAILDAADALRAKRRETLAELNRLLQSIFLDMFGDPVTNPKGWEIGTLGEWLEGIDSGSYSSVLI